MSEVSTAGLTVDEFSQVTAAARHLEAFLLARLDECEAQARQLARDRAIAESKILGWHEPEAILNAAAAWRQILAAASRDPVDGSSGLISPVMRYLATEFKEHPDYKTAEWRYP